MVYYIKFKNQQGGQIIPKTDYLAEILIFRAYRHHKKGVIYLSYKSENLPTYKYIISAKDTRRQQSSFKSLFLVRMENFSRVQRKKFSFLWTGPRNFSVIPY